MKTNVRFVLRATKLLVPILLMTLAYNAVLSAGAKATPGMADSLGAEIDSLRVHAQYGEATQVARKLLGCRKQDGTSKPYQIADAERLIETLKFAAALPPRSRKELAEADGLTGAIERAINNGKYGDIAPFARRQLQIRRTLLGDKHLDVAESLDMVAFSLLAFGDDWGAEPFCRESLAIRLELLGSNHPLVATSLEALGSVLADREDLSGEDSLLTRALAIDRDLLGKNSEEVAECLNNLALASTEMGRFAEAESLYVQALSAARKAFGDEHQDVATILSNLAYLDESRGDRAEAETYCREALAMRQKLLSPDAPDVEVSHADLGALLFARGEYAAAESLFAEAVRNYESARRRADADNAAELPTYLMTSPYLELAATRLALYKYSEAWPTLERSQARSMWSLLRNSVGVLSRTEQAQEDSLRLVLGNHNRDVETLDAMARTDSSTESRQRLNNARQQLLTTEARWSEFQRDLLRRHPPTEVQSFDLARVQAALEDNEAIVGWLDLRHTRLRPISRSDKTRCWGYVIRNSGPVFWQELQIQSPSERLSDRVKRWVLQLQTRRQGSSQEHRTLSVADVLHLEISRRPAQSDAEIPDATVLWEERFATLMANLAGVHHLIVIPSGEMLGIPVEALVTGDSQTMGNRFAISYAPSATIYTWLAEKRQKMKSADLSAGRCLAIADPPFNRQDLADMQSTSTTPSTASLTNPAAGIATSRPPNLGSSLTASLFRSIDLPDDSLESDEEMSLRGSALAGNREALGRLRRLPATRDEASSIMSGWSAGGRLLLGPNATEQELVRMARNGELLQYQIIHFATHALIDEVRPERSCLVLSQVGLPDPYESAVKGERIYDGLLDAREIAQEWKLDADLVTLSACETGLGKRVEGEGYIGLADAFLQAGAKNLVVSLWEVQDRSTAMLMKRFYEDLRGGYDGVRSQDSNRQPGAPMSKVDALQEAKRWLREWRDENGHTPYTHPYFWAGFVLVGGGE